LPLSFSQILKFKVNLNYALINFQKESKPVELVFGLDLKILILRILLTSLEGIKE